MSPRLVQRDSVYSLSVQSVLRGKEVYYATFPRSVRDTDIRYIGVSQFCLVMGLTFLTYAIASRLRIHIMYVVGLCP